MNEDKYFYLHSQDISTYYLKCLLFLWKQSKLKNPQIFIMKSNHWIELLCSLLFGNLEGKYY